MQIHHFTPFELQRNQRSKRGRWMLLQGRIFYEVMTFLPNSTYLILS